MEKETAKSIAVPNHNGESGPLKVPIEKQQYYAKTVVTETTGFDAPRPSKGAAKSTAQKKKLPPQGANNEKAPSNPKAKANSGAMDVEDVPAKTAKSGGLTKQLVAQSTGSKAPPKPNSGAMDVEDVPAKTAKSGGLTKQLVAQSTGSKAPPKPNSTGEWSGDDSSGMDGGACGGEKERDASSSISPLEPGEPLLRDKFGVSEVYSQLLMFKTCYDGDGDQSRLLPEIVSKISTFSLVFVFRGYFPIFLILSDVFVLPHSRIRIVRCLWRNTGPLVCYFVWLISCRHFLIIPFE
jgi:hypothetical protein